MAAVSLAAVKLGAILLGWPGWLTLLMRRAISFWQRDRGDQPTGYLTGAQYAALTQGGGQVYQPQTAPQQTSPQTRQPYDREEDDWRRATARNDVEAYREYLRQYPNGRYAYDAQRRINDLSYVSEDVAIARDEERRQNLTEGQRRSIEGRLASLGYDPGSQDGRFTQRTRDAIAQFQRAQGILESGYADIATVRTLVDLTPQVSQQELIGEYCAEHTASGIQLPPYATFWCSQRGPHPSPAGPG